MSGIKFWRPGTVVPGSSEEFRLEENGIEAEGEENVMGSILAAEYASSKVALTTTAQFREKLPIFGHRKELLFLLEQNQIVIMVGQTGSGKTTQLPQYLYEAGWTSPEKMVVCTQPRRVAAISVATRVAEEVQNGELGDIVGYSVRFEELCTAGVTRIKYMTDGMLFREALFDPLLSRYSVIMIDEAHERSLYTDLLLGLIKKILKKRSDLRLIISSATMDAEAFKLYYNETKRTIGTTKSGPPHPLKEEPPVASKPNREPVIISVQGRMYPVNVYFLEKATFEIVNEATLTVFKIHMNEALGDILMFLPGKEEIDRCISYLKEKVDTLVSPDHYRLYPLPLHAALPLEQQMKVFDPTPRGLRKVIVATNIAEASVTIDGIVYVIDGGQAKQKVFDPISGLEILVTSSISQASAQQRAGRAGRVRPGKAYRLYTEEQFHSMAPNSIPEIQKSNLATIILQLKALGIENILGFDFMAPPAPDTMARSLEFLFSLGALDERGRLTAEVGVKMAELPVDPMLARILIASAEFGCGAEAVTIAAMLAAQPIFVNVSGHSRRALDEARRKLGVAEGDLISMVNIFRSFQKYGTKWANRHFLSPKALQKAARVQNLLARYMGRYGLRPNESTKDVVNLQKCIVRGLFSNAAIAQSDGSYRSVRDNITLHIHPSSCLFKRVPSCVVFYDVLHTTKTFMREVTPIESDWLADLAPNYYEFRNVRSM